jgi:hypothetical protein
MISQLSLETELLLQLALGIGHGQTLDVMGDRALSTMLRVMNASGALLLQTTDIDGAIFEQPRTVAFLPRRLAQHPARAGLSLAYPDRRLVEVTADRPLTDPVILNAGRGVAMAWSLPGFGALVLFRRQPLTHDFLQALPPILDLLARTARRFAAEQHYRALATARTLRRVRRDVMSQPSS